MRAKPAIHTYRRPAFTEPYRPEPVEPPWSQLDADIVDVVRLLWRAGFNTCDSGDGHSKLDDTPGRIEALDFPHVFMTTDRDLLCFEAERLHQLLVRVGVSTDLGVEIEASYDPLNSLAILALYGVTNATLAAAS